MNALTTLKAALAVGIAANAEAAGAAERRARFLSDATAAEAEIRDLDAAAAEREGEALTAGQALPEIPLVERRRREKLERIARAARVAAGKVGTTLDGEIAERQRKAGSAVIDAALGASRDLRDKGQSTVRTGLEALISGLAELIAAQGLRDRLAGLTFQFDGGRHPPAELWSGASVARNLIESVPVRLRPEDFAEAVEAAAAERLAKLMVELEARE